MPVLQVTDLRKSYAGVEAVAGVSFSIDAGEVFGLLGPNGAGKSTTINVIASLLNADAGQVLVDGIPISRSGAYKQRIGYVPQEISLAERLTARENLQFFGRLYDLSGATLQTAVQRVLEQVGLTDRANDLVSTFSGGMKRRINIAASLLHKPALVLLDEPTAGVDPQARAYIFDMVEQLSADGRAILYTTHYMEEAQRLCKRTAIIDHGRILAMGTLEELIEKSKQPRELIVEARQISPQTAEQFAAAMGSAHWRHDDGSIRMDVPAAHGVLLAAAKAAEQSGIEPLAIRLAEANLESIFLQLTGRALRD